ncbi:AAA family ATPase midasin [Aspergillus clavatus NRRL 1]|uniref:Midasin n=1 Tax=Aspergillus clavatus (strain ATCC 1007 / CBS 513.65 / DSM 816 / NCTC 3887 / NRRL 1 / QM 1276 / 107) TaxID=344612 RepID=A1C6P9_ASPCL|nr:midasin, putative [Aspergillus clavatus NRRL 1]EAW14070.1 midasin, putative [Aspergillus clavatus NRRL 1]
MDGRPAYERLLDESQILEQLPNELAELIRTASGTQFLNALAVSALRSRCTESLFSIYEPIFVDLGARWLSSDLQVDQCDILSAFARILPFAPYLRSFASQHAVSWAGPLSALAASKEQTPIKLDDSTLRTLLLATFRLLSYQHDTFAKTVSPLQLQSLFQHHDRSIRYLAVRCFALYMRAADAATERVVGSYVADGPIEGEWEDMTIDYRCLGLWEECRWKTLEKQILQARLNRPISDGHLQAEQLRDYYTTRTAEVCGVLIPRLRDSPCSPSSIVRTPTAAGNLRKIATALLAPEPILLVGLPNSGKTTLINDIASTMGQFESMVTLHLNEQTDAKSLLGMYSTSPATGSFAWQPGVLTKAAREGRWILIEDLDRAPSEVIGLILPIIEKGELTIASRKERIKCAEGFKIIATMKSTYNIAGEEVAPSANLLGSRLWQRVSINSLSIDEIREVIMRKFSLLESRVPVIMNVYQRVCSSFHGSLAIKSSQGRTPGLRDLIKLCSRLQRRLQQLGAKTGFEATPESVDDEIFLDVVDVFLRYIPEKALADSLSMVVAEALQISPQRAQFCLHERTPTYSDHGSSVTLGREICQKNKVPSGSASRLAAASSRFASTRAAVKLMEQVAAAVQMAEPVLLVGETGIGKTTVVQQLANLMRQKLTVVNLSQQSESTDLLGGFKPVNIRTMAVPMLDEFNTLFELTFSAKKNQKFLASVSKSVAAGNWVRLVNLWHEAVRLADGVFKSGKGSQGRAGEEEQPTKKRKLDSPKYQQLRLRWERFATQLNDFEAQVSQGDAKFAFAFVQGKIVRALRNGEWVLLDEVNLASPDTLENIASLLHHGSEGSPSVLLSEAGDVERVFGHPEFRIFGAMNPATDAGKKDLPPGLRSRFTEVYVQSPDSDLDDLLALIQKYLGDLTIGDSRVVSDLAQLYMETKKPSSDNKLTDGAGQRPHFSIRTLVRALIYVIENAHIYGLRRAIFEGYCMSFLTVLSQHSERLLMPLLERHIFGNAKNARALLGQIPRPPVDGNAYVQFKHYWMRQGNTGPEAQPHYIITPFIEKNLKNLVRASSTRRFPVLLQGPTSAGKTSMIEYLAKVSGNKFVRINNHEHTDLQEYLGSYVSGDDGTLRYQEGVLVEALRNGYWIVLDELNLAPSDVLEAMNRLLDDNRELFIPETQEVVHPHPNFMLFATQNPAGLYGGRKVLSRAFRNRFLELHFDDIPESELEFILKERSQIAPSFCTRIVSVYRKLSLLRQANRLFEQKNSFATLRDLFRWALRQADDREQLAINGFMLLAERVRNPQERAAVKGVIEEVMKVRIDEELIYSATEIEKRAPNLKELAPGIVWTKAMRRLFILVSVALENNEPVLLVGETGCGKTQLCQAVADICRKQLFIVNAHVNLETGDLIGAQRPVRNRAAIESQLLTDLGTIVNAGAIESASLDDLRSAFNAMTADQLNSFDPEIVQRTQRNIARLNALFEWSDGSLITAMKTGQFFLLDEISLADDSVLERLNSVLEPHRSILLAEKGPIDSMVVAHSGFQFLSTMNPGGDYGKRELSAALRNRMTEIWAPQLSEDDDILPILKMKMQSELEDIPKAMLRFAKWFKTSFQSSSITSLSIRDLLAWVDFVNKCRTTDDRFSIVQGAAMVFVDTLGANPAAMLAASLHDLEKNRQLCLDKLRDLFNVDASSIYFQESKIELVGDALRVGPFALPISGDAAPDPQFIMDAPTTIANSVRIARGLQLPKPILLEGSPGVGKTTLVTALARALGKPLTRINLSEQTDLTDLFGSDVPVEGGDVGQFTWRDAPFLQAMQRGDWVLLDEMNLASQSVLEGLNSCLDHRQMVYVAELDQTFKRHPDFVLFAAQNPHHQGGGRKGLPASFVNRFTVVYADSFTQTDLKRICAKLFPGSPSSQTDKLVDFVSLLNVAINQERRLGAIGGPWEVNLRDIQRWLQLADRGDLQVPANNFLDIVISERFRSEEDRQMVSQLYQRVFTDIPPAAKSYYHNLTTEYFQVGFGVMRRDSIVQQTPESHMRILPGDLPILESLMLCIEQSWPSILVGPSGCGKTTLIRKLAALNGTELIELALSADTDTMDLIGGFEQIDYRREVSSLVREVLLYIRRHIISSLSSSENLDASSTYLELFERLQSPDISLEFLCSSLPVLMQLHNHEALGDYLRRAQNLMELTSQADKMKVGFEWTEGVLTQAVQHGHWVILDNANLCNPSVLDRLNSLTEPNGALILNEQRTDDGSARIVRPHPNFRLFLTMDPRHGELSRAMRNRCVEICFLSPEVAKHASDALPAYTNQSSLYRLRSVWDYDSLQDSEELSRLTCEVGLDHLSVEDLGILQQSLGMIMAGSFNSSVGAQLPSLLDQYVPVVLEGSSWSPSAVCKAKSVDLSGVSFSIQGHLQPLHPLVNEPLALILGQYVNLPSLIALAHLQECKLNLHRLKQSLLRADESAKHLKPSQMNCLERSLASRRIASLMKDPTQPISSFLADCGQAVYDFVQSLDSEVLGVPEAVNALRAVISFCVDLLKLSEVGQVDEGVFQVYLQFGRELCSFLLNSWSPLKSLALALSQYLSRFQENWALTTGLSMQRIWESWRPATPATQEQLRSKLDLEKIAAEFTELAPKTRLDLSQLSRVRNSLVDAQRSILLDGAEEGQLVEALKQTVMELANVVQNSDSPQAPYFSHEFEALCQFHDLSSLWRAEADSDPILGTILPLLAGRQARPLDASTLQSQIPGLLHKLSLFAGFSHASAQGSVVDSTFSLSLLEKLTFVGTTTLGQMDRLQVEKQALSKAVTVSSHQIVMDQHKLLRQFVATLTTELLAIHKDFFEPQCFESLTNYLRTVREQGWCDEARLPEICLDGGLPEGHYFHNIAREAFPPLLLSLTIGPEFGERYIETRGSALIQLARILLQLFVPDKPFDPSLGLVVQRQRHTQRVIELTMKSEAIAAFEMSFSGKTSNLRNEVIQRELQELGSAPPPSQVTRPQVSEISILQGEFSSLLYSVLNRCNELDLNIANSQDTESQGTLNLLRENIRQLTLRLSAHYRSYDDITVLVIRFLGMLDLGLSLQSSPASSADSQVLKAISKRTPFLGGNLHPIVALDNQVMPTNQTQFVDLRFHELSSLKVASNTDPDVLRSESGRHALHRIFEQFHILWKAKLREDQEEEAGKSELYRYRGSWEDSEEVDQNELNELFPTYENDSAEGDSKVTRIDPKAISVRLASLHAKLLQSENTNIVLADYVKQSARLLGSLWSAGDAAKSPMDPEEHLSGALLLLEDALNGADSVPAGKYNFYTDANFTEARRLVSLTHSVKSRFLQIQQAWPEHAVLQDVILCCKEVLEFKHTEPVAKFITKVEKLHALVHEWQLVASREYSAASLYDEITALIISWRRLELSTWAKLLDLETEKCAQDVSSWWFVAYEAIIAAPIQLAASDPSELSDHVVGVISTLEQFFMSTTFGQYSQRLQLVANFRSLVALYVADYPSLEQLVSALDNFLEHYRPFEPSVHKVMADRRSTIEKDLKQQIQLASWKDTNIIALRESARRSHFKLFKLVRKYREVLAQPVQQILQQGITDETDEAGFATTETALPSTSFPDALAMCQKESTVWPTRPPRFQNVESTAGNMSNLYSSMPNEFDLSEDLEEFVKFFIESIKEFKSQTPKALTEDNKDDVQHLKVQKRRFYADVLRRLMDMGVKRNANTSLIESQLTVAQVLATCSSLETGELTSPLVKASDLYFHRFLDLLPRVRQASRDYSEDLSNVEVSRSVGTVEHLLFTARKQRGVISPAISHLETLKSVLLKMSNIWASGPASICKSQTEFSSDRQEMRRTIAWLTPILGLAIEIIALHSKFSQIDSSKVSGGLHTWKATFDRLRLSLDNLPDLPSGITSQCHKGVLEEVSISLSGLEADIARWTAERPDLSFALSQIIPWVKAKADATAWSQNEDSVAIQDFDAQLLAAVDKILISLQKLKDVPSSLESLGSLSRSDEFFTKAMKAVHLSDVTSSLDSVLQNLQNLHVSTENTYSLASALVASLLPITNKYFYICQNVIQRFVSVHKETCKMSYVLAKSFIQIASEGFCTPAEPSTEESKSGKLESGTGLGEGEGAEDISKDVGDDEDLSELAQQEQNEKPNEDMEDSADAVNMDQEEMQGESNDREGNDEEEDDESGSEGEDDIDEEVGSVNDLDTTAVDEKMWDGAHDEQQKETENEQGKGASEADEQTAAQEKEKEKTDKDAEQEGDEEEEEEEEDEEAPEDEGEAVGREDMDVTDPHAKEEDALDLPDEMQLDGDQKEDDGLEDDDDDGMDDLADLGPPADDEQQVDGKEDNMEDDNMDQPADEQEMGEGDEEALDGEETNEAEGADDGTAPEEEEPEETQPEEFLTRHDDNEAGGEEVAPSEAVNGGLDADQDQNQEQGASGNAQQEDGSIDPSANPEQQTGGAKEGEEKQRKRDAGGADDASPEDPQLQAFKKLGDVLDEWHRRRKEIMNASKQEEDSESQKPLPEDTDMADVDFEHLADQDDVADTQALGQASEDQAKALDQNKGVESDIKPGESDVLPDTGEELQDFQEENMLEDDMQIDGGVSTEKQTAGAIIPDSSRTQERTTDAAGQQEINEELDEVDSHLAAIHLSSTLPPLTPRDEAQRLWSHYENATNDLSLSLTEQLRLILAPTLATKLRGDFRTGKRLNIKRIIPYIASQYKRDKIWMRRSIPSKRNYQIMLAVDDSKSMLESGSGQLAFETLALVAKSLSMLEAGDLCVLGFGSEDHVRVAHEFGKPFSSEAGTQVFQHFSYQQTGTNVRKLIADSIALFREARWKQSPAGGNADLWQLELIISDGICEDHETIQRLVRQAQEERIMIVFIIVDAVKGSSILDLTQASFEPDTESGTGEMKLKMKRYLEGFPFPYYLVVRDVRELPAVLATALKQWFAEVVDVSS